VHIFLEKAKKRRKKNNIQIIRRILGDVSDNKKIFHRRKLKI